MNINSKIESSKKIKELDLNKFPEQIFTKDNLEAVKEFIEKNPADFYAIRDKSKAGGVFKLKVAADKVLEEIDGYNLFSINVSSVNYVDNQLLVGEIEFLSNGEVYAILSLNPAASVRDAIKKNVNNISNLIIVLCLILAFISIIILGVVALFSGHYYDCLWFIAVVAPWLFPKFKENFTNRFIRAKNYLNRIFKRFK